MDTILKEDHKITLFHIYPQPNNFVPTNNYVTQVNFKKTINENQKLNFIVDVETIQSIDKSQVLCLINTSSKYELTISIEEISQYKVWYPLVQKSITECNNLYINKIIGTYLEGTNIALPTE